jgi:hypothetical protein
MHLIEEIIRLLPENLDVSQVSEEAAAIINKVYRGEELDEQEQSILLNPTETAAMLSAKYHRPVNHRYVKEITREVRNPKTGHVTPARLSHDKVAGRTYLYKAGRVLSVKLRQKQKIASLPT